MPASNNFNVKDIFTISGSQISDIYKTNRMTVHFQGMSKTLQFPQTIALQGAPTCSIGISPEGLYNRLNDAGRLILLNQNAIQLGSAPFIRIGDTFTMLTTRTPVAVEGPDDVPALKNYYHAPIAEDNVTISIATPLAELSYKVGTVGVKRRFVSPLVSGNNQALMPIGVEEYEVKNASNKSREITLVIPRPSLVNLQEKELKPTDQDSIYVSSAPVKGHRHEEFTSGSLRGVIMGSRESKNRMLIAVPDIDGLRIDAQPYVHLNRYKQDMLLNADGSFYEKYEACFNNDYGAAISITFSLEPKASITIPFIVVLDFPQQRYIDGKIFDRKYSKSFSNDETRVVDMAQTAYKHYREWWDRTMNFHSRLFELIRQSPAYKKDRGGALRVLRLLINEFSFPLSNAAVWIEDKNGKDKARFLECFDYSYIDPSDVDWYSMVILLLFPEIEEELCQRFIDSILAEDLSERFYHYHSSFVEARLHYEMFPEEYEDVVMTQIRDTFKVKGSVAHDLGMMPKGHALRNISDYAWYNNNYWIDLYPKLVLRVLRNFKFTGNRDFIKKNWNTLKFGFEYLQTLDIDGDGIPEGNPDEVKNTFDNLTLFGIDAYDVTMFMACCLAMKKMAIMMKDAEAEKKYEEVYLKVSEIFEKLWRDKTNRKGNRLQYYITCYDPESGKTNEDVWTNQLDAIWSMIAMGEEPFIPAERIKQILKTIYVNNLTTMGWCMTRTEDGEEVESEQGQDVYTTSNYVFAQLLHHYGMTEESKEVYKKMDKVVFEHGNSLITPDNLRAEYELEDGEEKEGPHYIVAAYPRPGAILSHIMIQYIMDLKQKKKIDVVDPKDLIDFITGLRK
ncbi:MAG: hypothetical protein JW881_12370 [Spirochaetales bacterium]|nr:hypothetical protein [Spirochaetales bacterium]